LCNAGDESWPASLFLSMDPVAIDSVAFDFLSLRADWEEVLLAEGVQDYLHEMAQANNPPSGTFYDPEHDGSRMASLGVHEHWNNATDKQYTRNLGTEDGIELLYMPRTTYVRKTDQPIVIDGESDTAWSGAGVESLNNVVFGTAAGLSATFRALYTDTDLYFVIDVTDDVVMSAPSTDWHDDDSVTILLDGDYSRGRGYDGANDFELGYRWNDLTIRTGANSRPVPAGAVFDMVRTVSGYRLEARLPLDQIGVTPTCGQMFGLDVRVNDDDDGGVRDAEIAWNAQVNDDGQYPYKFGAGRLAGPESILVEAGLEGNQVHLVWAHPAWYALYEVHRSAAPYFTPDETTKLGEVNAFDSEYLDTPPDNGAWYYLVRISESRLVANSNRTGRFQFDLSTP
jgi:hypothetical protein